MVSTIFHLYLGIKDILEIYEYHHQKQHHSYIYACFFKGIGTFRYFDTNLVSQVRIRNTKELGQLLININNEGKGGFCRNLV